MTSRASFATSKMMVRVLRFCNELVWVLALCKMKGCTGGRDSLACGSHAGVTSHARLAQVRASHIKLCEPCKVRYLYCTGAEGP